MTYLTAYLVTDHPSCRDIGPHYRCDGMFQFGVVGAAQRAAQWAAAHKDCNGNGPETVVLAVRDIAEAEAIYQRKCIPVAEVAAMCVGMAA